MLALIMLNTYYFPIMTNPVTGDDGLRNLGLEIREDAEREARIGRRLTLGAFAVWEAGTITLELTILDMPNPAFVMGVGSVFLFGAGCVEFSRRRSNRLSSELAEQARDFEVLDTYVSTDEWEQVLNEPRNTDT